MYFDFPNFCTNLSKCLTLQEISIFSFGNVLDTKIALCEDFLYIYIHRLQDTVDQSQNSHHASWSKLIYKVGRRAHEFSLYPTKYIAL